MNLQTLDKAFKFSDKRLKDLDKWFIGWDEMLNKSAKLHDDFTQNIPNYPPYNIRKTGENTYVLEVAVAGFGKNEIEIELDGDNLIVRGSSKKEEKSEDNEYIFQGIAARDFTRTWTVADQIEVKNAEMLNGMLRIFLERIIPEHRKPKKIEVKDSNDA